MAIAPHRHMAYIVSASQMREIGMSNLTIRMNPQEKRALSAWAEMKGESVTEYIKRLVADDMATGSPQERAAAWYRENAAALSDEARLIEADGVPGSHLAMNYPGQDA
jgi:hypothetical protein